MTSSDVFYAGETFSLVLNSTRSITEDMNRDDLYAVRFLNTEEILPQLKNFGTVLFVAPSKIEAIMSLTDEAKMDALAALLHEHGGVIGCGSILKLGKPSARIEMRNVEVSTEAQALVEQLITAEPQSGIQDMVDLIEANNISQYVNQLANYFNRHHRSNTGRQSADFIFNTFKSYANSNLTVRQEMHSGTPQPSVIARLEGTTKPNEIVIIGCHIDSLAGFSSSNHAPGADDNASGTACVKEILRVISNHNFRFKRTIEFHGYAAEEGGLIGSGEIAAKYRSQGKNVVGMLQIDMCLYSVSGNQIWIVTNDTNSTHNNLLKTLIDQYTEASWNQAVLTAGTSDHRSWTRNGFPAVFPFENPQGYNKSIHTANDTFAKSGHMGLALNIARLGMSYIASIAELD
jgi:leucyl aminopeptidase